MPQRYGWPLAPFPHIAVKGVGTIIAVIIRQGGKSDQKVKANHSSLASRVKEVIIVAEKQKKHLRGVGNKEQRMYEHIKEEAQKSGRYGERAEEVAARTVMKHHREEGHEKGE